VDVFDTLLSNRELRDTEALRLGVETFWDLSFCPFCSSVMDLQGHHCLACVAGGDHVVQHNEVRNTVHREAAKANMRPELEKAGLLNDLGWPGAAGRRPADTLLVNGACVAVTSRRRYMKVALDFAVVSPFGVGAIRAASAEVLATAKAYTETKRSYKNTQRLCEEADIGFEPIVFESTGGLEPEGQQILESILAEVAKATGRTKADVIARVKGRISIDLCRAQSRAIRRRREKMSCTPDVRPTIERTVLESILEEPPLESRTEGYGATSVFRDIRLS